MSGASWAEPPYMLPAGLELVKARRWERAHEGGFQFSLTVRTDSSGEHLVAAGVVTSEQLESLPPCGQRHFDKDYPAADHEYLGRTTRVFITKRKTVMRAEIILYGDGNPDIELYAAWAGFPVLRRRPHLRLVVDNT